MTDKKNDKKKSLTHTVISSELEKALKEALKNSNKLNTNTNNNNNYQWVQTPPQKGVAWKIVNNDPYRHLRDELEEIKERLREIEELPIINLLKEGMRNDDDDEEEEEEDDDSET